MHEVECYYFDEIELDHQIVYDLLGVWLNFLGYLISWFDYFNIKLTIVAFFRVGTYTDFKTNSESSSDFGDYHDADTIELQDMKNGGDVDQVQDHEQGPDFEQVKKWKSRKVFGSKFTKQLMANP